jgi:hypothetical protein
MGEAIINFRETLYSMADQGQTRTIFNSRLHTLQYISTLYSVVPDYAFTSTDSSPFTLILDGGGTIVNKTTSCTV